MDANFGPILVGPGYFRFSETMGTLFVVTYGKDEALFIGNDTNTYFVAAGTGTVTAFFGNGFNVARGGRGDANFVGSEGNNFFFGGMGNDTLIGGSNYDILSGGDGYDFIVFGENDFVSGGEGGDTFVFSPNPNFNDDPYTYWYVLEGEGVEGAEADPAPLETVVEYVTFVDFNGDEDTLDLSQAGIDRQSLMVKGDALIYITDSHEVYFEGLGEEITGIGGIDAAIENGTLTVTNYVPVTDDLFYP